MTVVNLNKARKARAQTKARAEAAENRVKFGRPKTETLKARLEAEKAERDLDGKRRDPD
jgi:hypothetical protein